MGCCSSSRLLATVAVVGSVCLGLALLVLSWQAAQDRLLFIADSWPIRANVVALELVDDDPNHTVPIISFTTFKGVPVRVPLPEADLSPGTTVNLLYDEDDPENFLINEYWHLWFAPWAFGLAGGLLTFVPPVAALWGERRKRL